MVPARSGAFPGSRVRYAWHMSFTQSIALCQHRVKCVQGVVRFLLSSGHTLTSWPVMALLTISLACMCGALGVCSLNGVGPLNRPLLSAS